MKRLFSQMVQRPVAALKSGMELISQRLPGRQLIDGAVSRFVYALVRPTSSKGEDAAILSCEDAEAPPAIRKVEPRIEILTATGESRENEEEIEMDQDLRDDMLKLIRYKVLFVKREYEHAFPEQEDLVSENMDGSAFTAWKVAEFIQGLARHKTEVPIKWGKTYPEGYRRGDVLTGLPDEDKKYLRVYFEVMDRYPREKFKYEEEQISVLEGIRDELERQRKC